MKANRKFVNGDEAVSPVIAVILMVAITVVLAATVYLFVSGFGSENNEIVTASFAAKSVDLPGGDTDTTDDAIELTYASGGGDLAASDIEIFVNGISLTYLAASDNFFEGDPPAWAVSNWCSTSGPGGSTNDQWQRGHGVYLIMSGATATTCDPGAAPWTDVTDISDVHQVKVVVRGQVVLDTTIEVHDSGAA